MPEIANEELAARLEREIATRKAAEVEALAHKRRADAMQDVLSQSLKELASSDGDDLQAAAKRFLFSLSSPERCVPVKG